MIHTVFGLHAVLACQPLLLRLASLCGHTGAAEFLRFFLSAPYTGAKKRPCLLLLSHSESPLAGLAAEELRGAVLLHEYCSSALHSGVFVSEDHAGERNVIARAGDRLPVAIEACEHLLACGAHMLLLTLAGVEITPATVRPLRSATRQPRARWSAGTRELTRYLALAPSYEGTLAGLGSHTRRNLRYYRKRLEAERGSSFVPEAEMSEEEFTALNRICSYPVPDRVAAWRYRSVHEVPGGMFSGMRDREGQWLSVLGCRRFGDITAIDWQMNRNGLAEYSLSTVMRAYLMEHEIARGQRRLLFEGGTPHSMVRSFLKDNVTDLLVVRGSLRARVVERVAPRLLPEKNSLATALTAPEIAWHAW